MTTAHVDVARGDADVVAAAGAPRGARERRAVASVALAAGALATAVLALASGLGDTPGSPLLADPGTVTRWGLPLARIGYDIAGMGTVGVLLVAVVLLPSRAAAFSPDARRLVGLAARWATAWSAAAAIGALLMLSDAMGVPVAGVLSGDALALALELPQIRAMLASAWLAGLVALWTRWTRSPAGGWVLLLTAAGAVLPPLLTGHARHGENHLVAAGSLALHVAAAAAWAGGLLALALHLRRRDEALATVLPRYSALALGCFVAVALSGSVTGWAALSGVEQLWTTAYGQLLLGKVVALAALGVVGHRHRRRTVAAAARRQPRAFLALAAAELVLMAGTAGLAVALSRTPPPPEAHSAAAALAANQAFHVEFTARPTVSAGTTSMTGEA